ncbi:MAG: GHKL domain-containing protein [Clostridiaceae bacterium]|nr:GHKL domain-containing protein [Clostridiaceae bacterium]
MIYEIIINLSSSLIGALLVLFFFSSVIGRQFERDDKLIFIILFSLLNGLVSTLMSALAYKSVILVIMSILIIKIILKVTLLQSFISFAIYAIGLAIGNALIALLASIIIEDIWIKLFHDNIAWMIIGNLASSVFALLLIIIIKPFKLLFKSLKNNRFLYILTAITLIIIASAFALHYYMDAFSFFAYAIISITVMSYCIFTIIVWFSTLKKTIDQEELAQQKFYNESLRTTLFDLRRFKHDWSNNMTVISSMLKMNKIKEVNDYVSELIAQKKEIANTEIFNIKNAGLFGIISSKMSQASEAGTKIELSVLGVIENIPGIKISELCEIVGIFIDNAIEEAAKIETKVDIMVRKSEDHVEISISNGYASSPDLRLIFEDGYSTKGDNRGMGLAIAKKIIDKYKNILHIASIEDNVFSQTIEIRDEGVE